jgi:putative iron-regulated protein
MRRAKYLEVVTTLLADDIGELADAWAEDGDYRAEFLGGGQTGLAKILTGLSTLTEVELAARLLDHALDWEPGADAPPDELAPFSDRTLEDLEERMHAMRNVYLGSYTPVDGEPIDGQGLSELVIAVDPDLDARVLAEIDSIVADIGLVPEPFETAIFTSDESRETVDDVRDGLRRLDALWLEVAAALAVDAQHGDTGDEDTETGDTGTDDGGTIFLPSSDMG